MTTLEWHMTDGGYVCGEYRINPVSDRKWSLEVDASGRWAVVPGGCQPVHTFGSLRSARAGAIHLEVVRVRRIKRIRHVTVAVGMFLTSVILYLAMNAATPANRLEWFVLSGAALVIALSESLDAFVLTVADGWDHRYEVPRVSAIDKGVSWCVVSLLWPKPRSVSSVQSLVRVVPPA